MRRLLSQFVALIVVIGTLAPFVAASVPGTHVRPDTARSLQDSSIVDVQPWMMPMPTLSPVPAYRHPFATEFYLQSLDDSNLSLEGAPKNTQHSLMKLHPVTAAASNFSKMVASWRHVLARMMP